MNSPSYAEHEDHRLNFVNRDSGVKSKAGKMPRDWKQSIRGCYLCNDGCKWLSFLVLSDPTIDRYFCSITLGQKYTLKHTHPFVEKKERRTGPASVAYFEGVIDGWIGGVYSVDWAIDVPATLAARQKSCISNCHNTCTSLRNPKTLKWSDYCADIALTVPNHWNTYDLPYCLVDIRKEVKYEKNDGKNFTNQADDISGVSVLHWIVLSWTIDKRIGQKKQENNVQWSLKTTKKGKKKTERKERRLRKFWKSAKFALGHEISVIGDDCNISFISLLFSRIV